MSAATVGADPAPAADGTLRGPTGLNFHLDTIGAPDPSLPGIPRLDEEVRHPFEVVAAGGGFWAPTNEVDPINLCVPLHMGHPLSAPQRMWSRMGVYMLSD